MIATILIALLGITALNAHTLTPRIKYGIRANRQKVRSVVRVLWGSRFTKDKVYGAGVVINGHWVLSAAHILKSFPSGGTVKIQAGMYEVSTPENQIQTVRMETVLPHEDYNGYLSANDIGLLGTNETIQKNQFVAIAWMPREGFFYDGEVHLVGWGYTRLGIIPIASENIKSTSVPIISNSECQEHLNKAKFTQILQDSQMCTFDPDLNPVPLEGDGGGPVMIYEADGERVMGIISWIFNTRSETKLPSVHTRVSEFEGWITNKIYQYPIRTD